MIKVDTNVSTTKGQRYRYGLDRRETWATSQGLESHGFQHFWCWPGIGTHRQKVVRTLTVLVLVVKVSTVPASYINLLDVLLFENSLLYTHLYLKLFPLQCNCLYLWGASLAQGWAMCRLAGEQRFAPLSLFQFFCHSLLSLSDKGKTFHMAKINQKKL